jgi:hypothetical protein
MFKWIRVAALCAAALLALAGPSAAQTYTFSNCDSPTVMPLTAGQTIPVGTVSVCNDQANLYVTYTLTTADATFGTLHLWVGSDLTNLPKNPQGVPVPGKFPWVYNAAGMTSYQFTIPFSEISIPDVTQVCGARLYVVSHAEVTMPDGSNETAFGGSIVGDTGKGRWWFYGTYDIYCDLAQPPVGVGECSTAFAKGGYVFATDKKANPENLPTLGLIKNRWGWAINFTGYQTKTYDIWAGAGLNYTWKGTLAGTLTVTRGVDSLTATYTTTSDFLLKELHLYAADPKPTTTAPGQYGYLDYLDPPLGTYTFTLGPVTDVAGDGIWLIAHAVVCKLLTQ